MTTVAVVGAGTIGLSWAALFAAHDMTVRVTDPRPDLSDAVAEALAAYGAHLGRTDLRVYTVADVAEAVRDADVVQENGPERLEVKRELFATLLDAAPAHALLLSSSSAIPATRFAADLPDASRVLIGHPFNPPHLMPLVEVVPGERTSAGSVDRAVAFYRAAGRVPVVERKEMPGFVGNRLQHALLREAVYLVQQGVVSPEDLDAVVTNSLGPRWAAVGPFLAGHLGGGPGGYRHLVEHIGASMRDVVPGEPSPDMEPVVAAVETAYARTPYTELAEERDRKQLAVLTALREERS